MTIKTLNATVSVLVAFAVWTAVGMLAVLIAVEMMNLCMAGGSTAFHLMHS
jgi:nitrate/nitrite transporter NarK